MDSISFGASVSGMVTDAVALKGANQRAALDVSLVKAALDFQKQLGADIARMMSVGLQVDIKA